MATGYNQTPENLYNRYQAGNVGISYTGLVYNLDVGYGLTNVYNSLKNRFVELSPNYQNRNFTISTPGSGLLASDGIGTSLIRFTGRGTDFATNDITATIPGIGTGAPSKVTVEMWAKINNFEGNYDGTAQASGGMMFSFGGYNVWTGGSLISNDDQVKLTASDAAAGAKFGSAIAVGSNKIVIGAERDNDSGSAAAGSVYIYNLDGTGEVKITAADAGESDIRNDDSFGRAVGIGTNKIAVGARRQRNEGAKGAVYVFDLDGTNGFKMSPSSSVGSGDGFGRAVDIGHSKIVVGAPEDAFYGSGIGSVYVYDLDGSNEVAIQSSDGATDDFFGYSVAIGHNKIVAGARQNAAGGSRRGAVYVYNLDGTGELKITASDGSDNDKFGTQVAIGNNKIVVGVPDHHFNGQDSGAVYVYDLDGTNEVKLIASDPAANDNFGSSVAVANNKVFVGAQGEDPGGAIYVYNLDGSNEVKLTASDSDGLSWNNQLSVGDNKVVAGDPGNDTGATDAGAAYVWDLEGSDINGTLGFNAFDQTTVGLTTTTVQSLRLEESWNHYVFVMTPFADNVGIITDNKIYINSFDQGTLVNNSVGSGSSSNRSFSNGNLKINGNTFSNNSGDYKLDMDVGALRVYDRELTSSEIIQNYNTTKESYFPQQIVSDGLVLNLDATNRSSVGVGTTWTDLSGNGNNGTLVNGTYHSDGPFLDAGFVSFDGTDDYIGIGTTTGGTGITTDFAFGTGDFTVEAWVRRNGDQVDNASIVCIANDFASNNWQLNFGTASRSTTNKIEWFISNASDGGNDMADSEVLPDKTWTHVAVTRSGTDLRLFKNGTIIDTATSSDDLSDDSGIRIGRNRGGTAYLNGQVSNVRLVKGTALYTSNFTPPSRLLTAVDNTVLLTCQKDTIRDGSIGIHTVTANNGPVANLGFPSSSYEFDGTNDYVNFGSVSDANFGTGDFAVECWFFDDGSTPDYAGLVVNGQSGGSDNSSFQFGKGGNVGGEGHTDRIEFTRANASGPYSLYDSTNTIQSNTWTHAIATRIGTTVKLYVNGFEVDSMTDSGSYSNTALRVGINRGGDIYWSGKISNVKLYKGKGLTAAEVLQNYNATRNKYPISVVTDGLIIHWDIGNRSSYRKSTGNLIYDLSSVGNNGLSQNMNSPSQAKIPVIDPSNHGSIVSNADNQINSENTANLTGADPRSLCVWIHPTEMVSGNSYSIARMGGGGFKNGFEILIKNNNGSHEVSGSFSGVGQSFSVSSGKILLNTWTHIALTYSGSVAYLYIDGVLKGNFSITLGTSANTLVLMNNNVSADPDYVGKWAVCQLYDREITASEVLQNYNAAERRYA